MRSGSARVRSCWDLCRLSWRRGISERRSSSPVWAASPRRRCGWQTPQRRIQTRCCTSVGDSRSSPWSARSTQTPTSTSASRMQRAGQWEVTSWGIWRCSPLLKWSSAKQSTCRSPERWTCRRASPSWWFKHDPRLTGQPELELQDSSIFMFHIHSVALQDEFTPAGQLANRRSAKRPLASQHNESLPAPSVFRGHFLTSCGPKQEKLQGCSEAS